MSKDVVDLDALAPAPVELKFADQTIEVPPPSILDLIKLGVLSDRMLEAESMTDEQITKAIDDIENHVKKCIPGLAEKPLSLAQLKELIKILSDMGKPPQLKDMEDKGITPDPKAEGTNQTIIG